MLMNSFNPTSLLGSQQGLKRNFPHDDVLKHDPVAPQTVEWVFESGGLVVLEKEVPDPSETITENRHQPECHPLLRIDCKYEGEQDQPRTKEVKSSTYAIFMFGQIVGIKLFKISELGFTHDENLLTG